MRNQQIALQVCHTRTSRVARKSNVPRGPLVVVKGAGCTKIPGCLIPHGEYGLAHQRNNTVVMIAMRSILIDSSLHQLVKYSSLVGENPAYRPSHCRDERSMVNCCIVVSTHTDAPSCSNTPSRLPDSAFLLSPTTVVGIFHGEHCLLRLIFNFGAFFHRRP